MLQGSFNRSNIQYSVRCKDTLADGSPDAVLQVSCFATLAFLSQVSTGMLQDKLIDVPCTFIMKGLANDGSFHSSASLVPFGCHS